MPPVVPASSTSLPTRSLRAQLDLATASTTARRVVSRRQPKLGHDPVPALMARSAFSEATKMLRETAQAVSR